MKQRDKQVSAVAEFMTVNCVVTCEACARQDAVEAFDQYEAADSFYGSGWRVVANDTLLVCKKCRRKKKK